MKRSILSILAIILLLCTACGQKTPTWQEQYDLGARYLSEGNYEEAIIAFNAAIEIDPKRADAYLNLANVYLELGDMDAAKKTLEDGAAATGDAEIQALLDTITAPADDTELDAAGEVVAEEKTGDAAVVSGALKLSNTTFHYTPGGHMAEVNEGAVGGLGINATVDGPEGVSNVQIASWYDDLPDEETLRSDIAMMVDIWAEEGVFSSGVKKSIPFEFGSSRPVYADNFGRTQYVLLIGMDGVGEALAYAVVEVKIPG